MFLLLLNTAGAEGIVALADEAGVVREERLPGRGTSEHLLPAIRRVLGEVRVRDLAAIGVVVGPGSFTGVRVGLAAAKGLCEAGAVKMVGMSRMALVAMEARAAEVNVFLDGGRGEFYCGLYREGLCVREALIGAEEARSLLVQRESLTCEERVTENLVEERWPDTVRCVSEPAGLEMLAMVRKRMARADWTDVALVDANYLRRTDAEIRVDAGAAQ